MGGILNRLRGIGGGNPLNRRIAANRRKKASAVRSGRVLVGIDEYMSLKTPTPRDLRIVPAKGFVHFGERRMNVRRGEGSKK